MFFEGDAQLIEALRGGDESAFAALFEQYNASFTRVAMIYVHDPALADEVVQETWIGVLKGLARFEGRSSLKTWIFSILINRAKTSSQREGRYMPLTSHWNDSDEDELSTVASDRFRPIDHPGTSFHWVSIPRSWDEIPEERFLSQEIRTQIQQAIDSLSPHQREVITLRDIEHLPAEDVCNILNISETNQRVLLHRARARVRQALENYLGE